MTLPRTLVLAAAISLAAFSRVDAQHEPAPVKVENHRPVAAHSAEHMSGWKALDAYHSTMMAVWHPAKEKNDFAPIRTQAEKLAQDADVWANAAIPQPCDTPDNRANIAKVKEESRALAVMVQSATDEQIRPALKALHDRFEVVNRSCKTTHH